MCIRDSSTPAWLQLPSPIFPLYIPLSPQAQAEENQKREQEEEIQGKLKMDARVFRLENPLFHALQNLVDLPEEMEKAFNAPTKKYVRDARAIASTPADVREKPTAYEFILDMPGVKSGDIKVQVEEGKVLAITGERRRETEDGVSYLRLERRVGEFLRKFSLPDDSNLEAITAVSRDGVLTVTVQKLPPPEPKKPKTIEVKIA